MLLCDSRPRSLQLKLAVSFAPLYLFGSKIFHLTLYSWELWLFNRCLRLAWISAQQRRVFEAAHNAGQASNDVAVSRRLGNLSVLHCHASRRATVVGSVRPV